MIYAFIQWVWGVLISEKTHRFLRTVLLAIIAWSIYGCYVKTAKIMVVIDRMCYVEKKMDDLTWRVDTALMMMQRAFDSKGGR